MEALADSRHRGVILQGDRQTAYPLQLRRYIHPLPAVESGRPGRRNALHAKRPRHHYANAQHPAPVEPGQRFHLLHHLGNAGKGGTRLGLLHQNEPAEMDLAGEIHQHDDQGLMVEMDPDGPRAGGVEAHRHRRLTASCGATRFMAGEQPHLL